MSDNRKIFSAILTVGIITLLVKTLNMGQEVVVASQFGISDQLDAFYIAIIIPSFGVAMSSHTFNSVLIPAFITEKQQNGSIKANQLFSSMLFATVIITICISLILCVTYRYLLPIIGSSFNSTKQDISLGLFYILIPTMLLGAISTMWSATLNAIDKFALPSVAPLFRPALVVCSLFLFAGNFGISSLAYGTLTGFFCEFLFLGFILKSKKMPVIPSWHGMSPQIKKASRQYVPLFFTFLLVCSSSLIDQSMAALLPKGGVSSLNYGMKLVNFILNLGATVIGTSLLPHFSRIAASQDWKYFRKQLIKYSILIFVSAFAIMLIVIAFSENLVSLMFQRGSFTTGDTALVTKIQSMYALQLPFYLLVILYVRAIFALQDNSVVLIGVIVNFLFNIALNYAFMKYFGASGIALSTSIVFMIYFSFLFYCVFALLKRKQNELVII
jgi:putative peptidoglycan lipid II flippase